MKIWKEAFLNKIRAYWLNKIDKVQILTGENRWTDLEIVSRSVEGNAVVLFTRVPDSEFTALSIRIIDTDGDVAGATPESISKTSADTFYITFKFPIYEAERRS